MADEVIVLDEEEKCPEPAPTHIIRSPFASAKKNPSVIEAENQKLFQEFLEYCEPFTKDCPDVLVFLKTKHEKACSKYLSSVEFRNVLRQCLTKAQSNRAKLFVYINELCMVLRQHSLKKRQSLFKLTDTAASTSAPPCSPLTSGASQTSNSPAEPEVNGKTEEGQPSTSGHNDGDNQQDQKKSERRLKKQVAYLENLLKMYNEEICRLQQAELSLDDMATEDSTYIQEDQLKNKMMKIYQKLCELKGCSSGTGRVIENKIFFKSTRYPEINKKIERFINSPQAKSCPPDYQDILQQVTQANTKYQLNLSKTNVEQMARDAFRETASQIQERRHLDLVYNFGCHLTDKYKAGEDPARSNTALERKLRTNRETSLNNLGEVISKYARLQDEQEDKDMRKRQKNGTPETKPGKRKEELDEEDEEEESSDEEEVNIDAELKASTEVNGSENGDDSEKEEEADQPDDEGGADDAGIAAGDTSAAASRSAIEEQPSGAQDTTEDTSIQKEEAGEGAGSSPVSMVVAPPVVDQVPAEPDLVMTVTVDVTPPTVCKKPELITPAQSSPTSPVEEPTPRRSLSRRKRKRKGSGDQEEKVPQNGDDSISLDMGVFLCDSPPPDDTSVACVGTTTLYRTPSGFQLSKRQKMVDKSTQCDPEETIVLSDSES